MNSGKTHAEVVVEFSELAEHQILRASYIDNGVMLYGDEDPTPVAVASNGQSADQVEVVGQPSSRQEPGWIFGA